MPGAWTELDAEGVGQFEDWEQPNQVEDADFVAPDPDASVAEEAPASVAPVRRGRGRPAGSKNKPKDGNTTVNVKMGAPTKAPVKKNLSKVEEDRAKVEAKAKELAQLVTALLIMTGKTEDSTAVLNGTDAWSAAVGNLAEHEEWLRKLCQGGETSGRITAWIGVAIASAGIAVPILANHDLLPGNLTAMIGGITEMATA